MSEKTMKINLTNRMRATYTLLGTSHSSSKASIEVRVAKNRDQDSTLRVRVQKSAIKPSTLEVQYGRVADLGSTIDIKHTGKLSTKATLLVTANNKMRATYELVEPSLIEIEEIPLKDAFVREESPYDTLNYGGANTLLVNNTIGERYESLIAFKVSESLPEGFVYESAKLRLYYRGTKDFSFEKMRIYENLGDWLEGSVTYLNRPLSKTQELDTEIYVNTQQKYIDIEVSALVKKWIEAPDINYGITLTGIEEEMWDFYSKESFKPPKLLIVGYDLGASYGNSRKKSTILVRINKDSDKASTILVKKTTVDSFKESTIFIRTNKNQLVNSQNKATLVPRLETQYSTLAVSIPKVEDKSSTLSVRVRSSNQRGAYIRISTPERDSTIFVRSVGYKETVSTIVTQPVSKKKATIEVVYNSIRNATIFINSVGSLNGSASLSVTREKCPSTIYVKHTNSKKSTAYIKGWEHSDKGSYILLKRYNYDATLMIPYKETSNTDSTILVERVETESKSATIAVLDNPTTEATIDVTNASKKLSTIYILQHDWGATLAIWYHEKNENMATLLPRELRISNARATLMVSSTFGGYVYMF